MRTVFQNGTILGKPGVDGGQTAQCMVINDDVVEFVGGSNDNATVDTQNGGAQVIDLKGKTILPGFIDGHMHLLMFGQSLDKFDIEPCKSLKEIQETIRGAAKANPDAKRLLGAGWIQASTNSVALASMIDGLDEQDRPIFIDAKDLHSCWCNTAALKELSVQDMSDPAGGTIHRDKDGNASGLLSEGAATNIVWPYIANVSTHEEKLTYIHNAIETYHAAGYTGMIEMATDENLFQSVLSLRDKLGGTLPIRLAMHWIILPSRTEEENLTQVECAIALHKEYNMETSPDLRIAGIKVICDGVIDACTAALSKPYSSPVTNADPIWPASHLKSVVHKADAAGLQCALHAIGDAAITMAIDTLSTLSTQGRRHRIEHLELTSPEDAKRLGEWGITASVQAVHSDPAILRAWPTLLGEDRLQRAFAYKQFHDHGANVALGTDSPTAAHLPFPNLYTATTRRSAKEPANTERTNPQYALGLMEALTAATAGAAYSCFAERRVGTLEKGMKADFVVVEMNLQAEKLLEAQIWETWYDGKCVFRKNSK